MEDTHLGQKNTTIKEIKQPVSLQRIQADAFSDEFQYHVTSWNTTSVMLIVVTFGLYSSKIFTNVFPGMVQ